MAPSLRDRLIDRASRVGVALDDSQLERLEGYWRLLERWNQRINLTSLKLDTLNAATIDRLMIEPLVAAPLFPESAVDWFDLGTGGGSPAVPLKIVRPSARLTMVESKAKKAAFLREVVRELALAEATVVTVQIEELIASDWAQHADLITVRAVRLLPGVIQAVVTLLKPQGLLLLFGSEGNPEFPRQFELITRIPLPSARSVLSVLKKS